MTGSEMVAAGLRFYRAIARGASFEATEATLESELAIERAWIATWETLTDRQLGAMFICMTHLEREVRMITAGVFESIQSELTVLTESELEEVVATIELPGDLERGAQA